MATKKKTMTQQALGLAAPMMPAPLAKVVSTRWGSRLFILLLPFLFATGILTISWHNGIPTVNVDRARAWLLGQQVSRHVEQEAVRVAKGVREQPAPPTTQSEWGAAQTSSWQAQPAWRQSNQPSEPPADRSPPATQPWGAPAYR